MTLPRLTDLAASLPDVVPFVGPEALARRRGRPFKARIGANENGFGPSPRVLEAIRAHADEVWHYGDPENHDLKAALARHLGIGFDAIAVGEGVDGLLGLIARLFIAPGTKVVTSLGGYPTFNFHVTGFGGTLLSVPYVEDREHLDGLLAMVHEHAAPVVYVANPDNPMGTWWPAADIVKFANALPETTLLILDEAYGETAPAGTMPGLDELGPNVLRTRTFSKAYGLAGARVGYAVGHPDLVRAFDRVRNHFGVNFLGQVAALAALADQQYLSQVIADIGAARDRLAEIARANGLSPIPSATNFVTIDCGRDAGYAQAVLDGLLANDLFVRKPAAPVLDRCIRVSVGPKADMDLMEAALPKVLAALS